MRRRTDVMTHGSGGSWAFVDLPDRLTRDRRHKPGASSNSRRTSSRGFESCPLRCTTTFSSLLSFLGTIGEQCCAQVDSSDAPLVIPAGRRVVPLPAFVASELKKNSVDLKERRLAHPELGFDSPLVCQQADVATLRVGRGPFGGFGSSRQKPGCCCEKPGTTPLAANGCATAHEQPIDDKVEAARPSPSTHRRFAPADR